MGDIIKQELLEALERYQAWQSFDKEQWLVLGTKFGIDICSVAGATKLENCVKAFAAEAIAKATAALHTRKKSISTRNTEMKSAAHPAVSSVYMTRTRQMANL